MDCPFCGESVPEGTKYCPECGFPFEDDTPLTPSAPSPEEKTGQHKVPALLILLIAAGILLIAGSTAAFFVVPGFNGEGEQNVPTDIPSAVPTEGNTKTLLTVTSNPSGATVYIGGKNKGITPLTAELVPDAHYAVFVELEGYEPSFASVSLKENEQRTMHTEFTEKTSTPQTQAPSNHSILGTWSSVQMIPDTQGTYYVLYYTFNDDNTGVEYWFKNGTTIDVCKFSWIKISKTEFKVYYEGFSSEEMFVLTSDGQKIFDSYGYMYKPTDSLPVFYTTPSAKPTSAESGSSDANYEKTFTWHSCGYAWEYTVSVPKLKYTYYSGLPRKYGKFEEYVSESYNREIAGIIANDMLNNVKKGFTEDQMVQVVIAFVQSIPYVNDKDATGMDEYYKYPIETLVDGSGDCEDTSILAAAILKEMGYDVALILFEDHMGVGIYAPSSTRGAYWEKDGKRYYYIETTEGGFSIGDIPHELKEKKALVLVVE